MACQAAEIISIIEELAPPDRAEEWDNVGLQVGSPRQEINAVLVSLDATHEVVAEAKEKEAGLLICHHPLIFHPLRRLTSDDPVGSLLQEAVLSGLAVYVAHTNLDVSENGVNVALAELLGLVDHRALRVATTAEKVKMVTFLPQEAVAAVSAALFRAGAGVIGGYTGCSFRVEGTGTFTPGPDAHPAYGEPDRPNQLREVRLEVVLREDALEDVLEAVRGSHPYEEPACDVYPLVTMAGAGLGRVGDLPQPMSLGDLASLCSRELANPSVRLAGDPVLSVGRVAVCGGSGAELVEEALRTGAQVLITGDVGYHQAMQAEAMGLAIIDAGHYHTERPVVNYLAHVLADKAGGAGLDIEVHSSEVLTCPWSNGGAE